MILYLLCKRVYLANLWVRLFILEYQDILFVFEYEIEKIKATLLLKRLSAWIRPYKFFKKYFYGKVNNIEYTKIASIVSSIQFFITHTQQYLFSIFYLFIQTPLFLFKSLLWRHILQFKVIYISFLKNTNSWLLRLIGAQPVVMFFRNSLKSALNISIPSASLIYENNFVENLISADRQLTFDFKRTFFNYWSFYLKDIFKNRFFKINASKYILLIYSIFIIIISYWLFSVFFYFDLFKNNMLLLVLVAFVYFLISTFFHFSKTYAMNKYTSQTQRFWKRTFGVFWGLEFILFTIYMFLTLISPAELPMNSINYKEIITGLNIVKNTDYHLFYFIVLLLLNFSYTTLIFLKKRNNFHFFKLFLFFINLFYCFIIYYEFLKFYYVAGWGTHTVYNTYKSFPLAHEYNSLTGISESLGFAQSLYFKVPSSLNNMWHDVSNEKQWLRTFRHFIYILLLLKFWHMLFIYLYFSLSLIKFLETNYMSFDVLSSNHQNSIYIIWFYLFSYLLIIKKKFYFLITLIYYWSFVQVNFTEVFQMLCNEIYIIYVYICLN